MTRSCVIAGTGQRAMCFARPLVEGCHPGYRLSGLIDLNPTRMETFAKLLGVELPLYSSVAAMSAAMEPDLLIVCTPDHTHPQLIDDGLSAGIDVVTEKPMGVDVPGIAQILTAERRTGRQVRVAFNMRYMPLIAKIKSLLAEGAIGQVRQVQCDWHVDRTHGTEYFRRWHGSMSQSGGMLVHKATHHFDLLNWFVDDVPTSVAAFGSLDVYGSAGEVRGERCMTCSHAPTCWAAMPDEAFNPEKTEDRSWHQLKALYLDAEHEDGYIRDRCVFRSEIDIYDSMSTIIQYRSGATANYSLTCYSPYQGFTCSINGTEGRMEVRSISPATRSPDMDEPDVIRVINGTKRTNVTLRVENVEVITTGHGGADERMLDDVFSSRSASDPLGRNAGSAQGAWSALIGICANRSIKSRKVEAIPSLDDLAKQAPWARAAASTGPRPPVLTGK